MGWFSDRAAPRPLGAARHERGLVRPPVRPLVALAMMFTVFASGLHCAQAMAAEVSAVRLWRAPDHTRVVLDVSETIDAVFPIAIEAPEKCPRYVGRVLDGVDLSKTTPLYIVERLRQLDIERVPAPVKVA